MSRQLRGLFLLLAVFAAGVAAGFGLDRSAPADPARTTLLSTRAPQVLKQLDLSPEQQRAIDSLMDHSPPRALMAMRETIPLLRAVVDSLDAELRQVLTPAQRARFDSLGGFRMVIKRKTIDGVKVDTL